jgi:hypothetical protein
MNGWTMTEIKTILNRRIPATNIECIFDPETHTYRDLYGKEYPSVTQILAHAKLVDYSMVPDEYRISAFTRGTAVHWVTQLEDEGMLNYRRLSKKMRGYRKAWNTWKKASGFVTMKIEQHFIDSRGYAGTPDRVGQLPATAQIPCKTFAIVDIKTGAAIVDGTRFQLSAYSAHYGGVRAFRRIALLLKEDGTYKVREFSVDTAEHDYSTFFHALKNWKESDGN